MRTTVALLVIGLAARPAFAPPPPHIPDAPGKLLAESRSYWLAPYTLYTSLSIGSREETRVQWFSPDGKLEHEMQNVEPGRGFVSQRDGTGVKYVSVRNSRWEFAIPKHEEGTPHGLIVGGTADGRTFVFSSRTTEWENDEWPRVPTTIHLFVDGEERTLGPYPGAPREIHLDDSGAVAFSLANGLLVVADRSGQERFRMTLGVSRENRILACNDRAVLVSNFDERQPIHSYGFDGGHTTFTIPGHLGAQWIGGNQWLFRTTLDSLLVVDGEKGTVVWRRGRDGAGILMDSEVFAVIGRYLVAADEEIEPRSHADWPAVVLRAYDLETGELEATWSCGCTRPCAGRLQFFETGGKRFLLDGKSAAVIDPKDIEQGREGWSSARPAKPAPPSYEEGPPASPLSWKAIPPRGSATPSFASRQKVAMIDVAPQSVTLVRFKDDRPYGEIRQRNAWLARYDSVLVRADSLRAGYVHLSAVFDAASGDLVCAFTDAASRWARTRLKPRDPEASLKESQQILPAAYLSLRSTPAEVLGALWRNTGIDPRTAAQIVVRPRFVTSEFPAKRFEGKLIPVQAPSNQWIVEVLGTVLQFDEYGWTTYTAQFLDGDLTMLRGEPNP